MTLIAAEAQVAAIERAGQRHTTVIGPTRIVWRHWGAGPPIVLVHDDAGSWTHWVRNVLPLTQRFRVIVPDLPGYGESGALSEPITPERLARALADGFDVLPGAHRTYRLAGFSFGGIVAGHKDLRRPHVRARPLQLRIRRARQAQPAGAQQNEPLHARTLDGGPRPGPAQVLALDLHGEVIHPTGITEHQDGEVVPVDGGFPASESLRDALPRIGARLHGIWGERDAFAAPYLAERVALLRRVQPGSDVRIIPGAGHWAPYEAADEVDAMLMEMPGDAPSSG